MTATKPEPAVKKARVLLVEDHPVVRHGLAMLINHEPDLVVCGEAVSVQEAIDAIGKLEPDVVIIDLALAESNGLDLIKHLHEQEPQLALLALSMHDEGTWAERALRAGARGYIMKKEAMDRVMTAIRRVLDGEIYVSEKMAAQMVRKLVQPEAAPMQSPVEILSEREFEVFSLIAKGIGPSGIAEQLGLSVKTIESYRERIKEKLSLRTGPELVRFAVKWAMEHT